MENEEILSEILSHIEEWNKKDAHQQPKEKLKNMVGQSIPFLKTNVDTISTELVELYKTYKKYIEYTKNSKNVYSYDLQVRINVISKLLNDGYTETKLQLIRARYNLKINNHIFRMLNYMINNDNEYRKRINESLYNPLINKEINIFKLTMSFFLVNLIFESIRDKIDLILDKPEEETIELLEQLIKEYNNDVQTIGEVLVSRYKDIKDNQEKHNKYRIMRDILISKEFDGNRVSLFNITRNSSSHGEFYPIIEENNYIDIKLDNNGQEKRVMSLQTLLTFVDSKISSLPVNENYTLLVDFYKSTDLLSTMEEYKNNGKSEEVIKLLAVLSMYNIVQYNLEPLYKNLTISRKNNIKKINILNIKKYFTTSYDNDEKENYTILETIKHAIGHMHIRYENDNIVFYNKQNDEWCMSSIFDLFNFSLNSGILNMAVATTYYQHYMQEVKERLSNINDIYNLKNISIGKPTDDIKYQKYEIQDFKINNYINNLKNKK